MPLSINTITISGRLTKDPVIKNIKGNNVTNFPIAHNIKYDSENTMYVNVSVWGKHGETCAKYLKKGAEVICIGSFVPNEWENDEGANKTSYNIKSAQVHFIGTKKDNDFPPDIKDDIENGEKADIKRKFTNNDNDNDDLPF